MTKPLLLLLACLVGTLRPGAAQTVSTPALTYPAGVMPAGDALSADAAGNLYASDFAGTGIGTAGNGRNVLQITPTGSVSVFVALPAGSGPAGSGFDGAGNFYVAAYNTGIVYRRTPQGVLSAFVSGLNGPTGLVFDASGNLYVAITGTTTAGTTVLRITPAGQTSTYATGFFFPGGLAFDSSGNLYVSNFVDGQILRVSPAGVVSPFLTVGGSGFVPPLGYLAIVGNSLYVTNIGGHQLFRINLQGTPVATVLAGNGTAGSQDGPAASARFNGPNGLVAIDGGATLYVTETTASPRRLRRIAGLPLATGAAAPRPTPANVYPNPAREWLHLSVPAGQPAEVSVWSTSGRQVVAPTMLGPGGALTTTGWPAGLYYLRVAVAGEASRFLKVQVQP